MTCPAATELSDAATDPALHDELSDCTACSGDLVSPPGASACGATCPAGSYADSGGCTICPPGAYSGDDAASCTACPSGKYLVDAALTVGAHDAVEDCVDCAVGKFLADSAADSAAHDSDSKCINCSAGKYAAATGTAACTDCPVGTFSTDAATDSALHDAVEDCSVCGRGTYADATGTVTCSVCKGGSYLEDDATAADLHDVDTDCTKCDAGESIEDDGVDSDNHFGPDNCEVCGAGKYFDAADFGPCTVCPAGKALSDQGQNPDLHNSAEDCFVCPSGTYNPATELGEAGETSMICFSCPLGKYIDATGSIAESDCAMCGLNYHVVGNACVECASGERNWAGDDPAGDDTACWSGCDGYSAAATASSASELQTAIDGATTGSVCVEVTDDFTVTTEITVAAAQKVKIYTTERRTISAADGSATRLFSIAGDGTHWDLSGILDLSGLTLTGGLLTGSVADTSGGAGILNNGGNLYVTDCIISSNTASGSGAGLKNAMGSAVVAGCAFTGNLAGQDGLSYYGQQGGGGVYNGGPGLWGSAQQYPAAFLEVTDSTFEQNQANVQGGGLDNRGTATLTRCSFTDNEANPRGSGTGSNGGGIRNEGDLTLSGCYFYDNWEGEFFSGPHNVDISSVNTLVCGCGAGSEEVTEGDAVGTTGDSGCSNCNKCVAGSSSAGDGPCVVCASNFYVDLVGATECTACGVNTSIDDDAGDAALHDEVTDCAAPTESPTSSPTIAPTTNPTQQPTLFCHWCADPADFNGAAMYDDPNFGMERTCQAGLDAWSGVPSDWVSDWSPSCEELQGSMLGMNGCCAPPTGAPTSSPTAGATDSPTISPTDSATADPCSASEDPCCGWTGGDSGTEPCPHNAGPWTCTEAFSLFTGNSAACPKQCSSDDNDENGLPHCTPGQPEQSPETCGTDECAEQIRKMAENVDALVAGFLTCEGDNIGLQVYGQVGAGYIMIMMDDLATKCGLLDVVTVEIEEGTCAFGVSNLMKLDEYCPRSCSTEANDGDDVRECDAGEEEHQEAVCGTDACETAMNELLVPGTLDKTIAAVMTCEDDSPLAGYKQYVSMGVGYLEIVIKGRLGDCGFEGYDTEDMYACMKGCTPDDRRRLEGMMTCEAIQAVTECAQQETHCGTDNAMVNHVLDMYHSCACGQDMAACAELDDGGGDGDGSCGDDEAKLAADSLGAVANCTAGFAMFFPDKDCKNDGALVAMGAPEGWFAGLCKKTCGYCEDEGDHHEPENPFGHPDQDSGDKYNCMCEAFGGTSEGAEGWKEDRWINDHEVSR